MFRTTLTVACLAILLAIPATAQESAPSEETLSVEDVSYTIGVVFGRQMQYGKEYLDTDVMVSAMKDVLDDKELRMSDDEMQDILDRLSQAMQENRADEFSKEGTEFLESKSAEEGVKVTGSGLMYKVLEEGSGDTPAATDTVRVHYTGSFTDGTVFDSSEGGEPVQFQLNQVIPGWTEGVQLMKEGAKYEFYIPYTLAYGEAGAPRGGIPPYATLVFQVELLDVVE